MVRHESDDYRAGFTIIEVIVALVISTTLAIAMVGLVVVWIQQYATASLRNNLTTNLETSLNRMADDIRKSTGALYYTQTPDSAAPTVTGRWIAGENSVLLLAETPRDATAAPLYTPPFGVPDGIVYYLSGTTLYRRVVAAQYANNTTPMVTCSIPNPGGGCPNDEQIARDVSSVVVTYYDKNGAVITEPGGAMTVSVALQLKAMQSGQTVTISNTVKVTPRSLTPQAVYAPLAAGPGGLSVFDGEVIQGGGTANIYSRGKIDIGPGSSIGSAAAPINRVDTPNMGCGNGSLYPMSCSPSEPITIGANWYARNVCATGQTTTSTAFGSLIGSLTADCSAPDLFLPFFNKAAHVAKITNTAGSQSCGSSHGCTITLAANTKYTGDVGGGQPATYVIGGDLYITGTLTSALSTFRVADNVTQRPIVMVNGVINLTAVTVLPNSAGLTPIFISFYSADPVCSMSDSCVSRDPAILAASVNSPVSAISTLAPLSTINASLYAYFGNVTLVQASLKGTIAGQSISLSGMNGTLTLTSDQWPN